MESSNISNLFTNHRFTAFLTVRLPRDLTTTQAKDLIRKKVVMPLQRRLKTQIAFIGVVVKHQPSADIYAHAHVSLFTRDGHTVEQMRAVLDLSQTPAKTRRKKAKDCPFCQRSGFVTTCAYCGTTEPSKPPSSYHSEEINLIQQTPAHAGYYDKPTNYGDLISYGWQLLSDSICTNREDADLTSKFHF